MMKHKVENSFCMLICVLHLSCLLIFLFWEKQKTTKKIKQSETFYPLRPYIPTCSMSTFSCSQTAVNWLKKKQKKKYSSKLRNIFYIPDV
jgi:hypothetical protein